MPNYVMFNIKMVKGDTESFGFEIEGVENLDSAYFSCKRNSQDENYLFQKSLNSGITQRVENQYVVRIDPDDTALLDPGQYWYDLEISKNDDVFTIFRGVLELLPEITTPTGDINVNTSWGRITGNINNQEDLQLEFQTKADVSSLSTVATTGLYSDLTGTPNLAAVATSGSYADLTNKPNLATVATSGSYNDLLNKPSIPTKTSDLTNDSNFVVSTSLAEVATTGDYSDLSGTPNLATVATTGSYTDLTNKPNFATVATSGLYSDLSGTPNLAAVATSGLATDLSGVLPITNGGTGASTVSDAKTNLGFKSFVLFENSAGSTYCVVNIPVDLRENIARFGFLYKIKSIGSSSIFEQYNGMHYVEFPGNLDEIGENYLLEAVRIYDTEPTLQQLIQVVHIGKNVIYTANPASAEVSLYDPATPDPAAKIVAAISKTDYRIAIYKIIGYTY